jgi:hypothetical protein
MAFYMLYSEIPLIKIHIFIYLWIYSFRSWQSKLQSKLESESAQSSQVSSPSPSSFPKNKKSPLNPPNNNSNPPVHSSVMLAEPTSVSSSSLSNPQATLHNAPSKGPITLSLSNLISVNASKSFSQISKSTLKSLRLPWLDLLKTISSPWPMSENGASSMAINSPKTLTFPPSNLWMTSKPTHSDCCSFQITISFPWTATKWISN